MKKIAILSLLFLIFIVGCESNGSEQIKQYVNEKYGYKVTFPEQWIGKVGIVEHDSDTQFVYRDVPSNYGTLRSISVMPIQEWDDHLEQGCCGSVELARNDRYVFVERSATDIPFDCSIDGDKIKDCKHKLNVYLELFREMEMAKHFTLTNP